MAISMEQQFLVLFVLFFSYCSIQAEKLFNTNDFLKREHSLVKPYQGSGANLALWDFIGSTIVTNNYVRLTHDKQSQRGALWNSVPCRLRDWEMQAHFKVHGRGRELFGDGFALWYTKDKMVLGDVFGSKDHFTGLGIFLDTYANQNGPHNHKHPYVSAMVNNGSLHYDHDRDGTHTEIAGCEAKFRNTNWDTFISIRYVNDILTVSLDEEGRQSWKPCFEVKGIRLPTGYYFGTSAATGDLADVHDIVSIKVFEVDVPRDSEADYSNVEPQADFFAPPRDHIDDVGGNFRNKAVKGLKLFAIVFCAVLGLLVCGIVGFLIYQRQQEHKRKRFY